MKITPDTQPPPDPLPQGSAILRCSTGGYAIVDADMLDALSQNKWYLKKSGYIHGRSRIHNGKVTPMHHVVLPKKTGLENDHINGIRWDNRRANLRYATKTENMQNQKTHANSTTGIKGVTWRKSRNQFHARISIHGKETHLGYFQTLQEAAAARAVAEQTHFKEFTRAPEHR